MIIGHIQTSRALYDYCNLMTSLEKSTSSALVSSGACQEDININLLSSFSQYYVKL